MNLKNILMTLLTTLALPALAQNKLTDLDVNTSTVCDMCEKTIETELIYEKGVKKVDVDLTASVIHVQYDSRKTDPARIRTAIAGIGYDADEVKADEKAWQKLPECCKKEGCGKKVEE